MDLIFRGRRPAPMDKARAILFSKTGERVVEPNQTRLITIQPICMRIYDKTILHLISKPIWEKIGTY
jgi:hypothetical protein